MITGDTIAQPWSALIFLPPNGYQDRGAIYTSARRPILGIDDPGFCGLAPPPGQLVEAAFVIRDDIWLTMAHLPDLSVVLTHIFTDSLTGEDAMAGRVRTGLLDEDAQAIEEVDDSLLAGVFASDDLLAFSPRQAFAQVTVWPPVDDPSQLYANMMAEAIPANHPLPVGLGLHCGYVSDEQLVIFEVWRSRRAFIDLLSVSEQSGPQVVEATCLGLYVSDELRFMT